MRETPSAPLHSPLPWRHDGGTLILGVPRPGGRKQVVAGLHPGGKTALEVRANGALIVGAVNAHHELLATLAALRLVLAEYEATGKVSGLQVVRRLLDMAAAKVGGGSCA
jgi:hypothetical protein